VLLVENGSTDGSLQACRRLERQHNHLVRTISLDRPSYGEAVKRGLIEARGDFVVILECDALDPRFVERSARILESDQADFVVASKQHPESSDRRPRRRRLLTRGFNLILRFLLRYPGTDTHGLKSINAALAKRLCELSQTTDEVFQTEIVLLAWRLGARICEAPIRIEEKRATPVAIFRRLPKVMRMVWLLRKSLARFPARPTSAEPK